MCLCEHETETMGAQGTKKRRPAKPPDGTQISGADKWGRDVLDQVQLWHREGGFPLTGTLSVTLLEEVRGRLQNIRERKKEKGIK